MEYAAMGIGFDRPVRPPVGYDRSQPSMRHRVDPLLKQQADTRECVRKYRLKKAVDETPPHILRAARLRTAMRSWLETDRSLGR